MATNDTCCTIVPYFQVQAGHLTNSRRCASGSWQRPGRSPTALYYGFCFDDHTAHCREGYVDAAGLLAHLENVGALLEEAFKIAEITRLEVHGPASELDKLREPLAALDPQFLHLGVRVPPVAAKAADRPAGLQEADRGLAGSLLRRLRKPGQPAALGHGVPGARR